MIGNVSEEDQKLVAVTKECLDMAIAVCKPGYLYRDLGNLIQGHASKFKYGVVKNICGHGIGREFHCPPNVPHYASTA